LENEKESLYVIVQIYLIFRSVGEI
jgi:hypothetical protein